MGQNAVDKCPHFIPFEFLGPPPVNYEEGRGSPIFKVIYWGLPPLIKCPRFIPFEFLGPPPPNLRGGAGVFHLKSSLLQISQLMMGGGGPRARGECVP